ncbi:hypothetical protein ACP70R_031331 [Stipagrostis hirtigluma subsp. patula]
MWMKKAALERVLIQLQRRRILAADEGPRPWGAEQMQIHAGSHGFSGDGVNCNGGLERPERARLRGHWRRLPQRRAATAAAPTAPAPSGSGGDSHGSTCLESSLLSADASSSCRGTVGWRRGGYAERDTAADAELERSA